MKIFALETDENELQKLYLIDQERVLLVQHYHWIVIFIHTFLQIVIFAAILVLFFIVMLLFPDLEKYVYALPIFASLLLLSSFVNGYIRYRYNFIMVTTEKVVCVTQRSFFYQKVNPTHLDAIVSTDVLSQLFGLFDCGKLVINSRERTKYSSKQVELSYIRSPNGIAGIIENAIVLDKNRQIKEYGVEKQEDTVRKLQKRADQE